MSSAASRLGTSGPTRWPSRERVSERRALAAERPGLQAASNSLLYLQSRGRAVERRLPPAHPYDGLLVPQERRGVSNERVGYYRM